MFDDPTRTLTLRQQTISTINKRYDDLKGLINQSIIENRVFHNEGIIIPNASALSRDAFSGLTQGEAIGSWNAWLAEVINELILEVPPNTPLQFTPPFNELKTHFMIASILEAYERGALVEHENLKRIFKGIGIDIGDLNLLLDRHQLTLQIIANRNYTALKGVTRSMSDQITRVISQSLIDGDGAAKLAKSINDRVDKIGKVRSRLIARTEIVNAHNLSKTVEAEIAQEILGEEIVMGWLTAGDELVRDTHVFRNGRFYSIQRIRQLIGEPNCRCGIFSVVRSTLPEGTIILRA